MIGFLNPMRCPQCKKQVALADVKKGNCPHCGSSICISPSYYLLTDFLIFSVLFLVGVVNYRSTVGGVWLLKISLLVIPLSFFRLFFVYPWLAKGYPDAQKFRLTFLGAYFTAVLLAVFYLFAFWGWVHVILHATPQELTHHLNVISQPLASVNGNFLITRERSFAEVLGILLANSWFYAIVIFACYSFTKPFLRRARVTQLGIGSRVSENDED